MVKLILSLFLFSYGAAPIVKLVSPIADGHSTGINVLNSNVDLTATAISDVGIAAVQFKLDGVNIGNEITAPPYTLSFNTASMPNGYHVLSVVARDVNGLISSSNLPEDLQFWGKFNEVGGSTAFDATSGQMNLTFEGRGTAWYFDKGRGQTISFSGFGSLLRTSPPSHVTFSDVNGTDSFTLSAWIKPTSLEQAGFYGIKNTIFYKGDMGLGSINYLLQITDEHSISLVLRIPGNGLQFYTWENLLPTASLVGSWTHLALVFANGNAKLYVNGLEVGTRPLTKFTDSNNQNQTCFGTSGADHFFSIGGISYPGFEKTGFTGYIDDARIYNRSLESAEILNSYNGQSNDVSSIKVFIENIRGASTESATLPIVRGFGPFGFDVKNLSDAVAMKATVIRQMYNILGQAGGVPIMTAWPTLLAKIKADIALAASYNVKVVVNIMDPPLDSVDRTSKEFWESPKLRSNFKKIWHDIATELLPYRNTIYGYDLFNEPDERSLPGAWRSLAIELIETIRAVDSETWIVYEESVTSGWTDQTPHHFFTDVMPLPDKRVIYSPHVYSPHGFTHQGLYGLARPVNYPSSLHGVLYDKAKLYSMLDPITDFQTKYNVPILVGEFSVARWAPHNDGLQWLTDMMDYFESRKYSWIYLGWRSWYGWNPEWDETYPPSPDKCDVSVCGTSPGGPPYQAPAVGETETSLLLKTYLAKPQTGALKSQHTFSHLLTMQTIPNPFNPSLCIQINSHKTIDQPIKLMIYDFAGRQVADLSSNLSNGKVIWDAIHMPSGVYLIHLKALGLTRQMKVTLLR